MRFSLKKEDFSQFSKDFFALLIKEQTLNTDNFDKFRLSLASSLHNIAEYCNKYKINITELDQIKVAVFSIPYLQKNINNFDVKKYIASIFTLLNVSYIYNKNFSIEKLEGSIKVCSNLIENQEIIAVYTYIKGFQESMESSVIPEEPFLYVHKKENLQNITHALISVSDKTGILEFAKQLRACDITIFSTGGTAKYLNRNAVDVVDIEQYTNFPEMMNGRIKTINPKVHGGILARRNQDFETMKEYNIPPIDLVVVNLYPFQTTIAKADCTLDEAIENIDIGGPAMLRSAAKNHASVTVMVDAQDYQTVIDEINAAGNTTLKTRAKLALKTFEHTAQYDGAIANYLGRDKDGFGHTMNLQLQKIQSMRYGENPHQNAAFYAEKNISEACVASAKQCQGKEMSYNNMADADAALECVRSFTNPCCVIVKHANPCGVATRKTILAAYLDAFKTDPTSAFGGVIAFNRPLDKNTAQNIIDKQFVEVIIAPSVDTDAKVALSAKQNIRVLECGELGAEAASLDYKRITGGLLVQDKDLGVISEKDLECVSEITPTPTQIQDLLFAWKVAKMVKSNAIVYAKEQMTIGIGAGQMSRVYSAKIAGIKANDEGLKVAGSVMASDAFFPFRDGIDTAAKEGIKAIIQPGGSVRDNEVIAAANEYKIAMVFTKMRHFKH